MQHINLYCLLRVKYYSVFNVKYSYPIHTSNIFSSLVSCISPSYWNGWNIGDYLPVFGLTWYKRLYYIGSHRMWNLPAYKMVKYRNKLKYKLNWLTRYIRIKLCVDKIYIYRLRIECRLYLILKSITIVRPITKWFKITE